MRRWSGGFMHNIGISTSVSIELWVMKCALELAWNLGFWRIILEVDSKIMARVLQNGRIDMVGIKACYLTLLISIMCRDRSFQEGKHAYVQTCC